MVTIEQIHFKYNTEDGNWRFERLIAWLETKGIPNTGQLPVASTTIEQILIELTPEQLPATHDAFDNLVLEKARANAAGINKVILDYLDNRVCQSMKKAIADYDAGWNAKNKPAKIWEIIRGRA